MLDTQFLMRCSARALLLAAVSHVVSAGVCLADGAAERARSLLTGMRDQRERLRQGVVHGEGHVLDDDPRGPRVDGALKFSYAFDLDADLYRCEREQPQAVIVTTSGGDPLEMGPIAPQIQVEKNTYFRQPGRAVSYNPASMEVQVKSEDVGPEDTMWAFDPAAVGLLYRRNYFEGVKLAAVIESLLKDDADAVTNEAEGVYRIEWTVGGVHRRTLWLDGKSGFAPVRFEVCDRRMGRRRAGREWPDPYVINEATWREVAGIWVPATWTLTEWPAGQSPDREMAVWKYEHTFDWRSVNEPVPKRLFTVESLECRQGTYVIDHRGQRPVVERIVGFPNAPEEGEIGGAGPKDRLRTSNWNRTTVLFVTINLVLAVAVAVYIAWRRRAALKRSQ